MIIRFCLERLSIIFLLVILLPLFQEQWLNLYLFDINNFTIYKFLYYLSGVIVPTFVVISSLNKFTYYKFSYHNENNKTNIRGKLLLLLTLLLSIILSLLVSHYILINITIFINFLLGNNKYFIQFDIEKQILFVVVISTFLLFRQTKFFIKKIILTNFFILSTINWYSEINNSFLNDLVPFYIFNFENIQIFNIIFLIIIEIVFYLWSYISYSSYLSDWSVPRPYKNEIKPIFNIIMFYLFIILYYSILFK